MIFELINLFEWKKKKDILKELKQNGVYIDERGWRKIVERHNKLYCEHKTDYYICHSNKGYILTKDENLIRTTAKDFKSRGIDQLIKASSALKALNENANFRLEIRDGEFFYSEI